MVEVSPEAIPPAVARVADVSATEALPVVPQINAPQTFEKEVGRDFEQTSEAVFAPVEMGEGSSHSAGQTFPDPTEMVQDLSFKNDKG